MTARIRRLPESVVMKIAAGEVIERPASVVKELVENAIDAAARRIIVEVAHSGQYEIRVSDDGPGMSGEDVELCVQRHATSKLRTPGDLFDIESLGFRGEALASIAAVSRMTLETCLEGASEGSRLSVEGGIERDARVVARAPGTTVEVRNLFFNTPARRKFLRHVDTESRYITQAIQQLAVAFPQIAFRLVSQGREVFDLYASDRRERASQILGVGEEDLLYGEREMDGVTVASLVTRPAAGRRSRGGKQLTVVRRRPIASKPITRAVYQGYGGLLPHNLHPQFVLYLDLDAAKIDVNVHPTKREVQFSEERQLVTAVTATVRSSMEMPETTSFAAVRSEYPGHGTLSEPGTNFAVGPTNLSSGAQAQNQDSEQISLTLLAPTMPAAERPGEGIGDADAVETLGGIRSSVAVWQVHDKYIIAAIQDGIAVIDQHVAHERIRYEEVLDAFKREGASSQQLLFPLTLELGPEELDAYREAEELFARLGFGVREFGANTVIIDAVPTDLRNWNEGRVFRQIVGDLQEELEGRSEATEALAASVACHTSIRAGERLPPDELEPLVRRLLKTREPFVCPHGRPIIVRIPLNELDRMFGRL